MNDGGMEILPYLCIAELSLGIYMKKKCLLKKTYKIMISEKMIENINAQVNAEMWAAHLYLSMSMNAWRMGCRGMGHWLRKQYEEEMQHAFKFIDYMQDRNAKVTLHDIKEVPTSWECPKCMFEQALEHERKISGCINKLCQQALNEEDYATFHFLQYFVGEQVEEEASVLEIVDTLKCFGDDIGAIYAYDNSLLCRE